MKLKKLLTLSLAALAACATLSFAACDGETETQKPATVTTASEESVGKSGIKIIKDVALTAEDYAFAIRKDNAELLENVNNLLQDWEEDGSLDALINSYFDGTATFSYENKTSTPQEGDFIMATNAYFPPFESVKGSKFTGVDVEIAYKFAKEFGKTLFVYDMEFDSIIPSVQTGKSDIGMAGMTVNETRLQQVNFATSYYSSSQVISVAADNTMFDECKTALEIEEILSSLGEDFVVGTQNATTGHMYAVGNADFGYNGFPNLTVKSYNTGALAMKDLQNGKLDAVILDLQPSLMIVESMDTDDRSVFGIFYDQFIVHEGYKNFFTGLGNTMMIAVFGLLIGFALGCVLVTVKLIPSKNILVRILSKICDLYVTLFRGTPMVVQLLLMHFALFPAMGLDISSVVEAMIIFGMNSGAYISEILRGGINAVDRGQMEAGRSLGFGFTRTMTRIILPQAIKNILPTLGNEFIALVKETSVVSFIAVMDLTKSFQNIAAATYEYFIPYIALAAVYLVIVLLISKLVKMMEKRLAKNERK